MRILLVDDHPMFREGVSNLLRQLSSGVEVDEASNAEQALQILESANPFVLALLEFSLPRGSGMKLLQDLRRDHPEVLVVMLSGGDSRTNIVAAIEAGARGFISKRCTSAIMLSALQIVLAGGVYIPPQALLNDEPEERNDQAFVLPGQIGLTRRQAQILMLIAQGKPNKRIADELCISESTVKTHMSSILRILGVDSRTKAVIKLGGRACDCVDRRA